MTVTSLTPSEELNVFGNDNLTISGTNLPRYLTDNVIDIEFSDAQKSKCIA